MSYIDLTTDFNPGDGYTDGPYPHCQVLHSVFYPREKIITLSTQYGTVTAGALAQGDGSIEGRFEISSVDWNNIVQAANTDDAIHQWLIDKGHAAGSVVNS